MAFVSAEAPLSAPPMPKWGYDRGSKILGAYTLFVDGEKLGVGPGRPRCAVVAPGSCAKQTPYDGFSLQIQPGATELAVEIHSYGRHLTNLTYLAVSQRMIFELVVRLKSGKVLQLTSSEEWDAYDADCSVCSLYRPTGNSGGRFGSGFWFGF